MVAISRREIILGVLGASVAAPAIVRAQDNTPLRIGGMLPLSGPGAIEGHQVLKGLEFAVREANEKGGALGRQIELVMEDDESNSTKGVTAVRRLIERAKVPVVVGTYPTAVVLATMKVAKEYKVPMLSGGSAGAGATDANTPGDPWFFRSWPDSNRQGEDTARAIVHKFGGKRVSILHDSSNYGVTLAEQVTKVVADEGSEIISRDSFNIGEQDFSSLLVKLRSLKPDVVYIGGWAGDGAAIVRQSGEVGLKTQFVGSGSMNSDDFPQLAGPASEGFAVATQFEPTTPNEFGRAFGERFAKVYNHEAGTLNALGFDSTSIAIEAIRRAGKPDGQAIQQILKTGMGDFPIVQGPKGATAMFDEKGRCNWPLFMAVIRNGKRVLL